MDDLVQWLGAQLDEDERIARAATAGPWSRMGRRVLDPTPPSDRLGIGVAVGHAAADADFNETAEHIAAHDPARVLREIDVDRELLGEYERLQRAHQAHQKEVDRMAQAEDDDPIRRNALRREADYLPAMLHVLGRWAKGKAAVYADRPGYREEWRP
ncbi:DUF6221 family protein [Streptomyces melanosporofaciens]